MKIMNESPARALLRHRRALARRLTARLGPAAAEDLASEALARGLARPSPDGRQGPWMETISRNLVRDERRREGRRGQSGPLPEDLAAATATPEDLVLDAERVRVVSAAMPAIPGELREALEARFFEDQDYEELARRCGISSVTARTRVHRGLARLRAIVGRAWIWIPAWPRGLVEAGTHAAATALLPAAAVAIFATTPLVGAPVGAVATEEAARVTVAHGRSAGAGAGAGGRPDAPGGASLGSSHDEGEPFPTAPAGGSEGTPSRGMRQSGPPFARPPAAAPASSRSRVGADQAGADGDRAPVAVQRLSFDQDDVVGDLKQPGSVVVSGDPQRQRFESLIEIPASFEPSMTKMIEDM